MLNKPEVKVWRPDLRDTLLHELNVTTKQIRQLFADRSFQIDPLTERALEKTFLDSLQAIRFMLSDKESFPDIKVILLKLSSFMNEMTDKLWNDEFCDNCREFKSQVPIGLIQTKEVPGLFLVQQLWTNFVEEINKITAQYPLSQD